MGILHVAVQSIAMGFLMVLVPGCIREVMVDELAQVYAVAAAVLGRVLTLFVAWGSGRGSLPCDAVPRCYVFLFLAA